MSPRMISPSRPPEEALAGDRRGVHGARTRRQARWCHCGARSRRAHGRHGGDAGHGSWPDGPWRAWATWVGDGWAWAARWAGMAMDLNRFYEHRGTPISPTDRYAVGGPRGGRGGRGSSVAGGIRPLSEVINAGIRGGPVSPGSTTWGGRCRRLRPLVAGGRGNAVQPVAEGNRFGLAHIGGVSGTGDIESRYLPNTRWGRLADPRPCRGRRARGAGTGPDPCLVRGGPGEQRWRRLRWHGGVRSACRCGLTRGEILAQKSRLLLRCDAREPPDRGGRSTALHMAGYCWAVLDAAPMSGRSTGPSGGRRHQTPITARSGERVMLSFHNIRR